VLDLRGSQKQATRFWRGSPDRDQKSGFETGQGPGTGHS
jgi:hypothetical protein